MKFNISNPSTGAQKLVEVEDERKLRFFMEKRMGAEVSAEPLGDEWKGYILKITGGNDKQGFPMKQGVLLPNRTRLLLFDGHSCYRARRTGERKRKSVRGCITGMDLSVLAVSIAKRGEQDIPALPDVVHPKRPRSQARHQDPQVLRPQQGRTMCASTSFAGEVQPKGEGKKPYTKAPKIQRLVTPQRLQHKRHRIALKKRQSEKVKDAANEYAQILAKRVAEAKATKADARKRRASSMRK
uniref:40S ribosomal protein S6 n=1 Tax=Pyricularia oryzae TaxID=318829 RepID=D4NXH4_PYROR|nr:40S ribosomal protein S6 [Pyricularia oryzae]